MKIENMLVPTKIVSGRRTVDGAGVSLVCIFGQRDVRGFDPFLLPGDLTRKTLPTT
ncbi:MAG: hypothetical protein PWP47_79 [Synergistaceae bacterium]|nr:hypothetical protein [Synergistaceae bacterium]